MSYKPDEKEWMAYLYDEMDEAERRTFEEYLLANTEAQQELKRLRNLRALLASVEDQEVIPPPLVMSEETTGRAEHRSFWQSASVRLVTSIAASLIAVILVGKLAGIELEVTERAVTLSFGARQPSAEPQVSSSALTAQEVQQMIDASVNRNNALVQASLEETHQKLEQSIRTNLSVSSGQMRKLVQQASTASRQEIAQFVAVMQEQNRKEVQEYFQLTSTEQKQYIENLLVDFAKYLQQQRNNDLAVMQLRLNNIEENTDAFKQETEQILASIITTVGGPVPDERRN